jgi:hypothetical protein
LNYFRPHALARSVIVMRSSLNDEHVLNAPTDAG